MRAAIQLGGEGLARLYRTDVPDEDEEPAPAAYCSVCAYVEFGSSREELTETD